MMRPTGNKFTTTPDKLAPVLVDALEKFFKEFHSYRNKLTGKYYIAHETCGKETPLKENNLGEQFVKALAHRCVEKW